MSYEERRRLFENIKTLVKSEYEQVFRILKKYKEPYTENSNGIFFDVGTLTSDAFNEMNTYMNFCLENRRVEESRVKEMATLATETNNYLEKGYISS